MDGCEIVSEADLSLRLDVGGEPFALARVLSPKGGQARLDPAGARPGLAGTATGVQGAVLRYELPPDVGTHRITLLIHRLIGMRHALVFHRFKPWWTRPVFLRELEDCPGRTLFMLWQDGRGDYGAIVPLVAGVLRAELHGGRDGMRLIADSNARDVRGFGGDLAVVARGSDPYRVVHEVWRLARAVVSGAPASARPAAPDLFNRLGWCTWDAFYRSVDAEKVRGGLASFQALGVPLGFVLLDDGWQQVNEYEQLAGIEADAGRFPGGLSALVRTAKDEFAIPFFGVWTTLQGYWRGIDPESPLARDYPLFETERVLAETGRARRMKMHTFAPAAAARFYGDSFAWLAAQGVDFVKVDNQGSQEMFLESRYGFDACADYHRALAESAARHLPAGVIHCMAMSADNVFNHRPASLLRNSDDFYPNQAHNPSDHLTHNCYNNLWTSVFAVPDWDMFQSHHRHAEFHAAARALSGGPIYVSDRPGCQDAALLRRLMTGDGRLLRLERPALPSPSCLFLDPQKLPVLLKAFSFAGDGAIGVLGCFNVKLQPEEIEDEIELADVPGLDRRRYAVYGYRGKSVQTLDAHRTIGVRLPQYEYELFTLAPIDHRVAAFGLTDKLAGAAALLGAGWDGEHRFTARLRDGGAVGFYSQYRPVSVTVRGVGTVEFLHSKGLVTAEVPARGAPVEVALLFS